MKFRTRYTDNRVAQSFHRPSRTKQEFKEESDMNVIVRRAMRGIQPKINPKAAMYADVSNVPSLQAAYELTRKAEEAFMTLPALLRKEIGNDPSRIGEITLEQYEKHGLLDKVVTPPVASDSSPGQGDLEPAASKPSKKAKVVSDDA